jgi:hypothetical protein
MIYIYGRQKTYSQLSDVLDIENAHVKEKYDYNTLKNMIKENTERYKQSKQPSRMGSKNTVNIFSDEEIKSPQGKSLKSTYYKKTSKERVTTYPGKYIFYIVHIQPDKDYFLSTFKNSLKSSNFVL